MKAEQELWNYVGGGCMMSDNLRYPCDDQWHRRGEDFFVYSTPNVHSKIPNKRLTLRQIKQLARRKGVSLKQR